MMPTRVPDSLARNRSWVAIRMATPREARSAISTEKSFAAFGSRPDVGSSSSSASARFAIVIAMPIFCRIPFEYVADAAAGLLFAQTDLPENRKKLLIGIGRGFRRDG